MQDYNPPYEITDAILKRVSSISEKLGRLDKSAEMDLRPHLRRGNQIRSIHSSLAIEANSLSLEQVRDVIDGKSVLGPAREIQEVKNAYEAYEGISSADPWSLSDLKRLHGVMTKGLIPESGIFRTGEEGVFNGEKCVFIAPPARLVPGLMEDLFGWMRAKREKVHPLILSSVFHYEFVFIHPFSDGNGRMARLWHTAILMQWNPIFQWIPLESQIEKFQAEYYEAIAACHQAGSSTRFIEFMLERLDEILDASARSRAAERDQSIYVRRLLDRMEPETPYTAHELLALLGLKSKETLRKNYLNPALEAGLVHMTVPDKPRSRNQRYIRREESRRA